MRFATPIAVLLLATSLCGAATRNNDDSCDISLLPAATLLLPYFEVDFLSPDGPTTLFTVTNTSPEEQIAHVMLWTDYAYPVAGFNIYLTGYDVQSVNLYDVLARGIIGAENGTGTETSPVGTLSMRNDRIDGSSCARIPSSIPAEYLQHMQNAFTIGRVPRRGQRGKCNTVGGAHMNAVGYATIDLVRTCDVHFADDARYFTEDLLWDNVLVGDFQELDRRHRFAEGGPMVHIRAIPEGGTAEERRSNPKYADGFHRTFYSRFLPAADSTFDARQPLPSLFAARWIKDSSSDTTFLIWREGATGLDPPCVTLLENVTPFVETVVFDEEENARALFPLPPQVILPIKFIPLLPATSRAHASDTTVFPRLPAGAPGGWIYMNLDAGDDAWANQAWVIVRIRATDSLSVHFEAVALGNGCTHHAGLSEVSPRGGVTIGPAPNLNP